MTKRALRRLSRDSEHHSPAFDDGKIRRLPIDRDWSPLDRGDGGREQGYVKTIRPKSAGQVQLLEAIDRCSMVMALGPADLGRMVLT